MNTQFEYPISEKKDIELLRKKNLDKYIVDATYQVFMDKIPEIKDMHEREGQTNMALDIAEAIKDNYNLIIEAGVGIGKSLAYLIPGLYLYRYYGKPIVTIKMLVFTYPPICQSTMQIPIYFSS